MSMQSFKLLSAFRLVCLPVKQLEPNQQLFRKDSVSDGYEWQSTGDAPFFLLASGLPLPGWQMLEVAMEHDQHSMAVRVYFDTGNGFCEERCVYLPLKRGRIAKRLFYMPAGVKALGFAPVEQEACFTITHLRIAWLTPWFAYDRLAQRIANMHYQFKGTAKKGILPELKQQASKENVRWQALALQLYDETFDRHVVSQNYTQWLTNTNEPSARQVTDALQRQAYQPLISILVPVYNPQLEWLAECLDSVLAQSYSNWQLCITDDASTDPQIHALLESYSQRDKRIEVIYRAENGHICAASNSALTLAKGEFVALLDHDDCLTTHALFHLLEALQQCPSAGLLYSDEDKLNTTGERYDPHFKPQWNPDLLLAQNYISHLGVYRTELVHEVGGFRRGYEGAQDHDLVLRVTQLLTPEQIIHIPKVLYHWRAGEGSTALNSEQKSYTSSAGLAAVNDHLQRTASGAQAVLGDYPNTYRVVWPLPDKKPLVSLLIPTRDGIGILRPCVDAILERTDYSNFEILILDNQSSCPETLAYMESVAQRDFRVRILRWDHPFNYSAINNYGAQQASGEILALVNNDIEPINSGWLTEMVRQVCRPETGCVGAKLYYPNDTIQHAGVILGLGGVAGHSHKYFARTAPGYFYRLNLAHNLSAVTAACLLVRKSVFFEVGGLNEQHLTVAFNDVDLCIKVREAGYRNLWTPHAELYHHESVSRGVDDNSKKRARAAAEVDYMRKTWGEVLDADPAYNPNLTLAHEDFSLR